MNRGAVDDICSNIYCVDMISRPHTGKAIQPNLEEKTFLELLQTSDWLSRGLAGLLKQEELSPTQYNVLRVLRGSPEGLPCGEIARRLITREPDITRLLDRMEKRGLISRRRETRDRRTVRTRITDAGLKTVGRLDEPIKQMHREQLGHLGRERLNELCRLLREARQEV